MMRVSGIAVALACLLPSVAWADCQDRIAVVENHPAVQERDAAPIETQAGPAGTQADGEETVREGGGVTEYAEGGPAAPNESWFTDASKDDTGTVLTHLDAARAAQQAGDEAACLDAIEQAETALKNG